MSQKLPVDGSKWVEEIFQFKKDFTKSFNKDSDYNIFWKLMFNIQQKNYTNFTIVFHF